jgi:hypothetical protein
MAGPNRPDESPKDFSFLNKDSVPERPSFPTLEDTPATSLPEMTFDSSPATVPDLSGIVAEPVSFPSSTPAVAPDDHAAIDHVANDQAADDQAADEQTVMMTAPETQEAAELPEDPAATFGDETVSDLTAVEPEPTVEPTPLLVPEPALETTSELKPATQFESTSAPSTTKPTAVEQKSAEKPAPEKRQAAPVVKKSSSAVNGYAIAITLLLIFCLMTGRLKLFGNAALESLPDIRPLDSNEFRKVPDGTPVPEGHVLKLGESRRFGDVVLTPVKVTREPLMFEQFQTKAPATTLTTDPVLKLWLRFENRSGSYAFPPFDSGLMSHRTPRFSTDESAIVNSMLNVSSPATSSPVRVLNFLQTMDNAFVIVGQQSGKVIIPEESLETFIACSEDIQYVNATPETGYTWRVQFRKGVHESSGHGVTTLVDVLFSEADITDAAPPASPATSPAAG